MCFVDEGGGGLGRARVLELVLMRWVPETGVVNGRDGEVLCNALDPRRYPLCSCVVIGYDHAYLDLAIMLDRRLAVDRRQTNLPHAKVIPLHLVRVPVPAIEVADEVCSQRIGCPLAVNDGAVGGDVEAEALVAAGELLEAAFGVVDGLDPLLGFAEAAAEGGFEGVEVRVEGDDAWEGQSWCAVLLRCGSSPVPSFATWPGGGAVTLSGAASFRGSMFAVVGVWGSGKVQTAK